MYWKNREEEYLKNNLKTEEEYKKEIARIYDRMMVQITKEINDFYVKYAKKEGITMAEAKKRVKKLDIEAYAEKAKKYVKNKDFSDEANEEMRLYNLTMKINRLEMLKAQIGLELVDGFDDLQKYFDEKLTERTLEEFKRQAGILGETVQNNAERAKVIVNASFHNASFSDRIWMNQTLLKSEISKLLQTGIIQGRNPRVLASELVKKFGVNRRSAERLMITELARVQTESQKQSFELNGFTEYTFIVNGDCCPICAAIDGKHFKVKDMMPGENAAPMHPNCRCSSAPYEDDEEYEAWLDYLDKGGTTEEWNKLKREKRLRSMKLSMPEEVYKKSKMNTETRNKIDSAIRKLEREYTIYLDKIEGEELGKRDIFITGGYIDNDGVLRHSLVINCSRDFQKLEKDMKLLYDRKIMAGKNIEDYIAHEMAHIIPFQNCINANDYNKLNEELKSKYIEGISGYSDKKKDGRESLAEAFVRYRNGEDIPEESMKMISKFILPWKR